MSDLRQTLIRIANQIYTHHLTNSSTRITAATKTHILHVLDILDGFFPNNTAPASAPSSLPCPGTVRMLDNLSRYKRAATRHRLTLIRAGDAPDQAAYTRARNAYTLAHATYAARLKQGRATATPKDNQTVEIFRKLLPDTTGATFPTHLQATADYLRTRLFPTPPTV